MKKPVVKQRLLFQIMKKISLQMALTFVFSTVVMAHSVTEKKNTVSLQNNSILSKNNQNAGLKVKGKVTDENGLPLPSATVLAKGTKVAVLTDIDGNFSIEMPENSTKLVISYIGMKTREIQASANFHQRSTFRSWRKFE